MYVPRIYTLYYPDQQMHSMNVYINKHVCVISTPTSSCLHRIKKYFLLFHLMHTIIKIIECYNILKL